MSCQKLTNLLCTTKSAWCPTFELILYNTQNLLTNVFFPQPSWYADSFPRGWQVMLPLVIKWMIWKAAAAEHIWAKWCSGKDGVTERAQHCRLSNGAWPAPGMCCRWRGCEQVSGTAAVRSSRNPRRFLLDIGIWCQCSQKHRWCFNTHNSLNSHHLDPKETAYLDFLIGDYVLLPR